MLVPIKKGEIPAGIPAVFMDLGLVSLGILSRRLLQRNKSTSVGLSSHEGAGSLH